jgi:hypothetical protein
MTDPGPECIKSTPDPESCQGEFVNPESECISFLGDEPQAPGGLGITLIPVIEHGHFVTPDPVIGTGATVFLDAEEVIGDIYEIEINGSQSAEIELDAELVLSGDYALIMGDPESVLLTPEIVNVNEPSLSVSGFAVVNTDSNEIDVIEPDLSITVGTTVLLGAESVEAVSNPITVPEPVIQEVGEVVNAVEVLPDVTGNMAQTPSVNITGNYYNGSTGSHVITVSNFNRYPTGTNVRFELYDNTNSVTLGWGVYKVGDTFGVTSPQSSSGANWNNIIANCTNPVVSSGMSITFLMTDWIMDVWDLESNLSRSMVFRVSMEIGSQSSSIGSGAMSYDYQRIQINHSRTGSFSLGLQTSLTRWSIIDFGDGLIQTNQRSAAASSITRTYSLGGAKNFRAYIPNDTKVRLLSAFSMQVNSVSSFDVSQILTFRFGTSNMTTLFDFNAPSCTFFEISGSPGFVSPPSVLNLRSTPAALVRFYMYSNSGLTSLPSGWGLQNVTDFDMSACAFTSIPNDWACNAITLFNISGNTAITSLPSWAISTVTTFNINGCTQISSIPSSWNGCAPSVINIANTNITTWPTWNMSACTQFIAFGCGFTNVPVSPGWVSPVRIEFQLSKSGVFTAWNPTSVPTSVTQLRLDANANFTTAEVDDVLAQTRASWTSVNRAIILNLSGCQAPSAAGVSDRTFLNANGCTVTTT